MDKALVIVESPAKAKTIHKFLGRQYTVLASMGHVRDLPAKKLGVDIEKDFKPSYVTIPGKKATLAQLKEGASQAEDVYLAVDLDREGEAIAWHLSEALKLPPEKTRRVVFNEITAEAIRRAFEHPRQIDMDKVNAQQARRVLDRLVGYLVSPLLWKKIAKGLSAGRVQSVAVRLIVERERAIKSFVSEEFWRITATLAKQASSETFEAELKRIDGEKVKLANQESADKVLSGLEGAEYVVGSMEKTRKLDKAPPPFTTSLLQQQASVHLRFSTKRTMMIAQQLYEGMPVGGESVGLITYMRTDSFHIADQARDATRELIRREYGAGYVPERPNVYRSRKTAQEAHECIRPTYLDLPPGKVAESVGGDALRLYELIWNRFLASQMSPAVYHATRVEIQAGECVFEANGRQVEFPGHTVLAPGGGKSGGKEVSLPELSQGEKLDCQKLAPTQHFTEPPPRYTEATLVRELEKQGIGRPSTYAAIISTIQQRGYVKQVKRAFHATPLGMLTTDRLVESFPKILSVGFTRRMEADLDRIEEGKVDWVKLLREFYDSFSASLERAKEHMDTASEESDIACEACGKPMVYRWSRYGRFLGCSGYPECKHTVALDDEGAPAQKEETGETCPECGSPLIRRDGRRGPFLACSGYPKCKYSRSVGGEERQGDEGKASPSQETCPECGGALRGRRGSHGFFVGCSNYPTCTYTTKAGKTRKAPEPTDEKCDKCGSPMVIREGRHGRFLACSAFPKCRNARSLRAAGENGKTS
ncbi:MAG: type I DNA topoisomerase [Planctomycetota bacterium]